MSKNGEIEALIQKPARSDKWINHFILFGIVLILGLIFYFILFSKTTLRNPPESSRLLDTKADDDRRFYIDYEKNEFIKDGQEFQIISGSVHYFRVPRPYWRDRIRKMKSAGLNAVSFYIEWSFHEPYSGVYDFEGQADIEYFLTILKEEDMLVLIRPGPYIAAERDFGGYPYWLLKEKPSIHLRSRDSNYIKYVKRWYSVLFPKIVPFLYGNGGNIIMVQIENEYGHGDLKICDEKYLLWLRDLVSYYVGGRAQLYTNNLCLISSIECGHIPNVYATVDFGSSLNVTKCFSFMKQVQKKGPLMVSEYYTGLPAFWNASRPDISSKDVVKGLKLMLSNNVSINFYMFHGGTNFGFTSGANSVKGLPGKDENNYFPQITSYDFTAPLNEAGDPTDEFFDIKRTLAEAGFPTTSTPKSAPKGNYGTVNLLPVVSLFDSSVKRNRPVTNDVPLCFEDMDLNQGFVLYETELPPVKRSTKLPLVIDSLWDRAIIFLNGVKLGTMSRTNKDTTIEISVSSGEQKLSILVENQGRFSEFRFINNRKGILSNVTLGNRVLGPWLMTGYPLNDTSWLESQNVQLNTRPPAFYKGVFILTQNNDRTEPLDTFLDTSGWSKGVAFINGINIGRYWPAVGPQITLYVPAPYLVLGSNTIVMVELEAVPKDLTVKFVDRPRLDG